MSPLPWDSPAFKYLNITILQSVKGKNFVLEFDDGNPKWG
jgi:hypothetical protein